MSQPTVILWRQRLWLSHDAINRIWRQHRLAPHRVETFKLSKDPKFVEKLRDFAGLYRVRSRAWICVFSST